MWPPNWKAYQKNSPFVVSVHIYKLPNVRSTSDSNYIEGRLILFAYMFKYLSQNTYLYRLFFIFVIIKNKFTIFFIFNKKIL